MGEGCYRRGAVLVDFPTAVTDSWFDPRVLERIGLITGPVIGFLSAWLLFELTERRRRQLAQQAMRRALLAELRQAELVLSGILSAWLKC